MDSVVPSKLANRSHAVPWRYAIAFIHSAQVASHCITTPVHYLLCIQGDTGVSAWYPYLVSPFLDRKAFIGIASPVAGLAGRGDAEADLIEVKVVDMLGFLTSTDASP